MTRSTRILLSEVAKRQLAVTPLDRMTATGIVEESGINRKTLYRNFENKYDLARSAIFDDLRALLAGNFLADTWETGMANTLEYVIEHQAMFHNIGRSSYASRFRLDLEQLATEQFEIFVDSVLLRERPGIYTGSGEDRPLVCDMARFFAVAVTAVIVDWFNRGMRASPRELTDYLCTMFRYATTDAYDLRSTAEDDKLLSLQERDRPRI